MIVAATGVTGFVGSHLGRSCSASGDTVVPLSREDTRSALTLARRMAGADAVINLAGAPIIARWTEAHKRELYNSRIGTTRALVDAMASMDTRPRVLVSTSAVGIYRPGGTHTESSFEYDSGFLGKLARDWENEAMRAEALGVRVVIFRFGIVLGGDGGALAQMLPMFRLGLGGVIGSGRQDFPWVHVDDLIAAMRRALADNTMRGTYNMTAPNPVTNREFTKALARALGRPAWLPVPEFALTMKFGEGARVLVEGQRALPERLLNEGFKFKYSTVESALADCVRR